jgi:hypothetical protein
MRRLDFTNRKPSLAVRPSSLPEGKMGLGLGWWSVKQSLVERRSAARDGGSYNKKKER